MSFKLEYQNNIVFGDLQALPYSLEAEQTVLGAILIEPSALVTALDHLKPESFFREQHRDLFSIMVQMFSQNTNADLITVLNEAVRRGIFSSSAEGKQYLADLMNGVPSVANIESYCKIVEDKFIFVRWFSQQGR